MPKGRNVVSELDTCFARVITTLQPVPKELALLAFPAPTKVSQEGTAQTLASAKLSTKPTKLSWAGTEVTTQGNELTTADVQLNTQPTELSLAGTEVTTQGNEPTAGRTLLR